jgi:hypothetical protein
MALDGLGTASFGNLGRTFSKLDDELIHSRAIGREFG